VQGVRYFAGRLGSWEAGRLGGSKAGRPWMERPDEKERDAVEKAKALMPK
jgi:hypothetical protein